tara:strand:+ start:180 stop:824 length:645 start_codon:yes stop_codon:yes gene_type:complete
MAGISGPNIVMDGLVFGVDAANSQSYSGSGTTWNDISGNGNNGTLYSSPTFSNDNGGKFNFESADYVDCGFVLSQTAYTKSAWFRPESATANIVSGPSQHAFWMANTDDTIQSGHQGAWTTVSHTVPSGNMLNQWWNGAVTWNDSTGWVLYLNGVQVDTNSNTADPNGTTRVYVARYGSGNYFDGDIAEVLIYNRALTAAEIFQNYKALKPRYL